MENLSECQVTQGPQSPLSGPEQQNGHTSRPNHGGPSITANIFASFLELCSFPFFSPCASFATLLFGVRGSPVVCHKVLEVNRRSLELRQLHSGTVFHQNMLNQTFYQRIQFRDQDSKGANITGEGCDTVRH